MWACDLFEPSEAENHREMAPARVEPGVSWPQPSHKEPFKAYEGPPRNVETIHNLRLDPKLQPKKYEIAGTHPESKILFKDVSILDSTGREPYSGDVLIEGEYCSDTRRSGKRNPEQKQEKRSPPLVRSQTKRLSRKIQNAESSMGKEGL